MKKILFFFLIISSPLLAQTGKINGVIYQNDSIGSPGVYVALKQNNKIVKEAVSDIDGKFTFDAISAGEYSLKLKFVGNRKKVLNEIEIETGEEIILDILYPIRQLLK